MDEWRGSKDVPADNLKDFNTTQNQLSLWLILNDKSNLNDVIASIATTRQKIEHFDYLLFDSKILDELGILLDKSEGDTANDHANSNWHFDGMNFSGRSLVGMLSAVISSDYESDRYMSLDVKNLVIRGIEQGDIHYELINSMLKENVRNPLA
jgi:hypothetical protein